MLPDGYILKLIRKYNLRLLYWIPVLAALSVLPALHQAGKPKEIANWDYLAISVLLMIAFINLVKFLIWNSKPVLHPAFKFLGRNGDPEELTGAIDADALKSGADIKSSVFVAGSWIVYQSFFRFKIIPLSDVVWHYQKNSGQNPKKKGQVSLVIFTADGKAHLLKCRQLGKTQSPAAAIARQAPWSFRGYSEKMLSRWKTNRKEMIVEARARFLRKSQENLNH